MIPNEAMKFQTAEKNIYEKNVVKWAKLLLLNRIIIIIVRNVTQ